MPAPKYEPMPVSVIMVPYLLGALISTTGSVKPPLKMRYPPSPASAIKGKVMTMIKILSSMLFVSVLSILLYLVKIYDYYNIPFPIDLDYLFAKKEPVLIRPAKP